MILKHNKELCEIQKTTLYDDKVTKTVIKNHNRPSSSKGTDTNK
jgi:hypothetical protein